MAQWRKDLRIFCLSMLALVLWVLPWVGYGAACLRVSGTAQAVSGAMGGYLALTFDDGPRRETTTLLLDGLAQRGVHATFFVIGTRITGQEDLLLRMAEQGHQVGIHSYNHKVLSGLSKAQLAEEVDGLANALFELLGQREFMLRPPYGMTDNALRRSVPYPIILWSVDPEDWSDHDVERQVKVIVEKAKDGDIILLHDIYYASVETALHVVDTLLAEGYYFVTVEELFAIRGMEAEAGEEYRKLYG